MITTYAKLISGSRYEVGYIKIDHKQRRKDKMIPFLSAFGFSTAISEREKLSKTLNGA